mgnify:CR=1 FL=1
MLNLSDLGKKENIPKIWKCVSCHYRFKNYDSGELSCRRNSPNKTGEIIEVDSSYYCHKYVDAFTNYRSACRQRDHVVYTAMAWEYMRQDSLWERYRKGYWLLAPILPHQEDSNSFSLRSYYSSLFSLGIKNFDYRQSLKDCDPWVNRQLEQLIGIHKL